MATGTFDLIHPGHGYYLEESKLGGHDARLVVQWLLGVYSTCQEKGAYSSREAATEVVQMLKWWMNMLGSETDMFSTVKNRSRYYYHRP